MRGLIKKFENNTVFSADESWTLFKLAAFAEAIGWTLLIIGIGLSRYAFSNNQIPVQFAGRIHGILFLLYFLAALGLYPTLKWSRYKALVALLASIPPYGSLMFEIWSSGQRKNERYNIQKSCITLRLLTSQK